ncbi:MAG: DUF305 domain-containing protein [Ilumatobacteraceae bacterium]|jgi:uncharacterized protein (DUF305 family)
MTRTLAALTAAAVLGLGVAACGGSGEAEPSATTTAMQDFNGDDVMFAQMMIPHHEQAIEMSDIALDPTVGAGDEVRRLATAIKAAQDPEIAQMMALLEAWGRPVVPDDGTDHSSMMMGMLSIEDLEALGALTGAEFDQAWLEAMIAHHEGAIEMAEDAAERGANAEVRALAAVIIAAQQAEIAEMRELLG